MNSKAVLTMLVAVIAAISVASVCVASELTEAAEGDQAAIRTTTYPTLADAIAAADAGDEVRLLMNVELTSTIKIDSGDDITLNLDGKTLTMSSSAGKNRIIQNEGNLTITGNGTMGGGCTTDNQSPGPIKNNENATLTIENGTFIGNPGYDSAVLMNLGTMTVNGGTIKDGRQAVKTDDPGKTTINGGTFSNDSSSQLACIYNSATATENEDDKGTVINNGTFIGKNVNTVQNVGTMWINGGTFSNTADQTIENKSGTLRISGGTFTNVYHRTILNTATLIITGGSFSNTNCSICGGGTNDYVIRQTAGEMTIGGDATVTGVQGGITVARGNATINGGTFQTVDCTDPNRNHAQSTSHYPLYISGSAGVCDVDITGGTFTGCDKPAVYVNGNVANNAIDLDISEGNFEITKDDAAYDPISVIPVASGLGGTIKAIVSGGTFDGEIDESILASGLELIPTGDGKFEAAELDESNAAAKIGDELYPTFSDAYEAATDGAEIVLLKTVELDSELHVDKSITINLNGINHTFSSISIGKDHTLTITDTGVEGELTTSGITVDGKFVLSGGTISQIQSASTFITSNGGTIDLAGGEIVNVSVTSYNAPVMIQDGTLTMSGTIISGCSGYFGAISAEGSNVTFTGGEITSNTAERGAMGYNAMVYLADCTTVMEDVTISGNTQRYSVMAYWSAAGGSFSMSGGTLSDGDRMTLFLSTTDADANPTISISGGTIAGEREAIETDFAGTVYIDLSGNPDISGELFIYNSSMPTDGVIRLNTGFEPKQTVRIVLNSEPTDGYTPLAITDGAESELEHVTVERSGTSYIPVIQEGKVILVKAVTIVFKDAWTGNELVRFETIPGAKIPYDEIAEYISGMDKPGYHYRWVDSKGTIVDFDTYTIPEDAKNSNTIYPYYWLNIPVVTVDADRTQATEGETITLTAEIADAVDGLTYTYAWFCDGE